jgi:hypothetical protein
VQRVSIFLQVAPWTHIPYCVTSLSHSSSLQFSRKHLTTLPWSRHVIAVQWIIRRDPSELKTHFNSNKNGKTGSLIFSGTLGRCLQHFRYEKLLFIHMSAQANISEFHRARPEDHFGPFLIGLEFYLQICTTSFYSSPIYLQSALTIIALIHFSFNAQMPLILE